MRRHAVAFAQRTLGRSGWVMGCAVLKPSREKLAEKVLEIDIGDGPHLYVASAAFRAAAAMQPITWTGH